MVMKSTLRTHIFTIIMSMLTIEVKMAIFQILQVSMESSDSLQSMALRFSKKRFLDPRKTSSGKIKVKYASSLLLHLISQNLLDRIQLKSILEFVITAEVGRVTVYLKLTPSKESKNEIK